MPTTPAHQANDRLRAYVREHAGQPWTPETLAELARLRSEWMAARGYVQAA